MKAFKNGETATLNAAPLTLYEELWEKKIISNPNSLENLKIINMLYTVSRNENRIELV